MPVTGAKKPRLPFLPRPPYGASVFLRAFLGQPHVVGAVLPSSKRLAHALMAPFKARIAPAKVLEVGAGTGAVTQHLGHEMGDHDELAVCEIHPTLAEHVQHRVLVQPQFGRAMREQRVRLWVRPVQEIDATQRFDYIISGLPFTAFKPDDVAAVLDAVRRMLRPGGVFSYFEYVALRRLKGATSFGKACRRIRAVSAILDDYIRRFQVGQQTVLANFPPAYAHFWRFDSAG